MDADRLPAGGIDEQLQCWVSDAEVAEIPYTPFASKPKAPQVTARLIVRRVRDQTLNRQVSDALGELFPAWRHHAVFTDTALPMLTVEADHRRHAIVEQVIDAEPGCDYPRTGHGVERRSVWGWWRRWW